MSPEEDESLVHLNVDDNTDPKVREIVARAAVEEGVSIPKTRSTMAEPIDAQSLGTTITDWGTIPVDAYWFTKSWGRSPLPDENRMWEFELVTFDINRQQDRMFAKMEGPFGEALKKAQKRWDGIMATDRVAAQGVHARKVMVLSS